MRRGGGVVMILIGMIFQLDKSNARGMIMFTDGQTREFSLENWVDTQNEPKVGQKISYVDKAGHIEIQVAAQEDELLAKEAQKESAQNIRDFDARLARFVSEGFKLVKQTGEIGSRNAILRLYTSTDYGEVNLREEGAEVAVAQSMNGKVLSSF